MKPRLVFVHGIGAPRDAEAVREEWLRALAAGARAAGHSRRAAELFEDGGVDARFASYGDLFTTAGAQGAGAPAPVPRDARTGCEDRDELLVAEMLLEVLEARLADPDLPPDEVRALRQARARLVPPAGQAQGVGSAGRHATNALTSILQVPGLRRFGGWVSARATVSTLGQVARYLNRGEPDAAGVSLDCRIRERVGVCLDADGPTVVVAHSLGTVVATETLHAHRGPVPLFVTLGSPLGVRTAVKPRVRPQPLQVPDSVGRWLNFWDRDDVVAARPLLEDFVHPNKTGVRPESARVDSDGPWVHPATLYLAQPAVAGPLAEALDAVAHA